MNNSKEWYVRTADGNVYGPADMASLVKWAEDGRVDASGFVSNDRITWIPSQLMEELAMTWLVEIEPGRVRGPYNRKFLVASSADGSLPASAKIYRRHDLPVGEDSPPEIVEKEVIREVPVEKIVVKEVIKEVPVEKIVEKIVEVPVEKVVVKEVIKEVPVEKIVEKIVEVEKPPKVTVVEAEVIEPVDAAPPPRIGGIFDGADRSRLAALEEAARRELAAAGRKRFGFFGRK